jgi:hypothetical protein
MNNSAATRTSARRVARRWSTSGARRGTSGASANPRSNSARRRNKATITAPSATTPGINSQR